MHERKSVMAGLADGFIALPGGLGTLEELLEVLSWAQLGVHWKPVGCAERGPLFTRAAAAPRPAVEEGFALAEHVALLQAAPTAAELLDLFAPGAPATGARGSRRRA